MSLSRTYQRRARRLRSGGFTLIELMISLIMGLMVALAAVALSRAATTTFFEQAKISSVEANVRTASERLRNDLTRVAFMSTPNVQVDPKVAYDPSAPTATSGYRVADLVNLQGITIVPGASKAASHALTTDNSVKLHELIIAGNMTSDDVYRGTWISASAACGNGGAQIRLNGAADPAVRRLYNGETDLTKLPDLVALAFMPGLRMSPPVAATYAVQVMDARGCFHYLTICAITAAGEPDSVILSLSGDGARGILTPADTGGDVCGASLMEEVAIAPVHRVRWYVGPESVKANTDEDPELDGPIATTRKFNLYRQLLDSNTKAAASAGVAPKGANPVGDPEVIAEYAVDLRLGLSIDSSGGAAGASPVTDLDFNAADSKFTDWAAPDGKWGEAGSKGIGPHRVRSVRYRMAFRSPYPDRQSDLPLTGGYLVRYKMGTQWARVRTVTSEVALVNQAKATY